MSFSLAQVWSGLRVALSVSFTVSGDLRNWWSMGSGPPAHRFEARTPISFEKV